MAKKIYIGKLSDKTTEDQLREAFTKIGEVVSLRIVRTANFVKNSNYGYVQMDSMESTKTAIKELNNSTLDGSHIKVMEAHYLDQDIKRRSYFQKRKR
ncbi:MAG: RNA-binding protein [bacterium]|nr:RNA-binding protein [bacterium]